MFPFLTFLALAQTLPMPSVEQLALGRHWSWSYYTQGDLTQFYSAENYEIVEVSGSLLTFEISSKYDEQGSFTANTRFQVDLNDCYHAFDDPENKKEFNLNLYPLVDGSWAQTPISVPSTAFEEKFNCNPVEHSSDASQYVTKTDTEETNLGTDALFQQLPKSPQSQIRSLYFLTHPGLVGVAYRKDFNPGTSAFYEMILTDH